MAREKIAILGGGLGSLAAAFELTDRPGWQTQYEITVYQLGWRLGGKGASGRNQDAGNRIEEHGLHVWLGFYDNAFNMIQRCYHELGRPADAPLATWRDAFKAQSFAVAEEYVDGRWVHWPIEFPFNRDTPGDLTGAHTPWTYVWMLLQWMAEAWAGVPEKKMEVSASLWEHFRHLIAASVEAAALNVVDEILSALIALASLMHQDPARQTTDHRDRLVGHLEAFLKWFRKRFEDRADDDDATRRAYIVMDLLGATVRGMLADDVVFKGFDSIDHYDFREWLRTHGATEVSLESAWIRAGYDLVFGFRNGDPNQPALAAGTGLRGGLRMMLSYKGAIMWKMQAGMGDVVFAPLYEVLKRRGVQFKFFHRVTHLGLSPDHQSIATIRLGLQATMKGEDYHPLITVDDLPCWPSEPLYDQLNEGVELGALKQQGAAVNLESAWTPWTDKAEVTLVHGEHFHQAILGISLAGLPHICVELLDASEKWRDMVERVETARTQAFQLWLKPSLRELGWGMPTPILGGYAEPLDTWADMSHLIRREHWPPGQSAGHIAYFCGPMLDSKDAPFSDPDFPRRQSAAVKQTVLDFLQNHIAYLWPLATTGEPGAGLDWNVLVDPTAGRGALRLDAQFWRANIDPSERYVLSVPGSTQFRLKTDESGFANLYLVGDWIRNGLNSGCVESAVMSGMQASRAIAGYPQQVSGEFDF